MAIHGVVEGKIRGVIGGQTRENSEVLNKQVELLASWRQWGALEGFKKDHELTRWL